MKQEKTQQKTLFVTGDRGIDRFIYLEEFPDKPADLREAWVGAKRFWTVSLDGGAGTLIQLLKESGLNAIDPCHAGAITAESIYILTKRPKDKYGKTVKGKGWCIGQSIVAGEREYASGLLNACDPELLKAKHPAVILDFNQGWRTHNEPILLSFLNKRPYIIRTHDPRKKEWTDVRRKGVHRGVWFSPVQDLEDGSLWVMGNWENLHTRIIAYLKSDPTLWNSKQWLHYIVIQISYDGALVLGPGMAESGELLIYKGDQPGSFSRENYGTVLAGGIVFLYSLCDTLFSSSRELCSELIRCTADGLSRVRNIIIEGYVGPGEGEKDWTPPKATNLPLDALAAPKTDGIITYSMTPKKPDWRTAADIVCGSNDMLKEKTVLRLGNLMTACPDYADTILRLTSRMNNHVNRGKGVFSFCIFGGPGSGKSFIAQQIAAAIDPDKKKFQEKTFNLSQYSDQGRLIDAFKEIQTISLTGKMPFVLWDEFDTYFKNSQAGWLPSFLMPMQDAEFFDGTANLKLGKCIFVFIGGTFEDERDFSHWASKEGRILKGPDFHSRLDSSLNAPSVDFTSRKATGIFQTPDPAKLVRAILIRAFMKGEKNLQSISEDVLAYLIHVPLKHGVRSLQKIINASEIKKTSLFQLYHLPPLSVLELHVDETICSDAHNVKKFLKIIGYKCPNQTASLELMWRR